jgi:signal peptidase II
MTSRITHFFTSLRGALWAQRVLLIVASITGLLDQLSKQVIFRMFFPGQLVPVIPGCFNLTLTFNPGAAFGLWSNLPEGWRQVALGVSIAMALGVVFFFLRHTTYQSPLSKVSLAAILGGAIGNLIDRLVYGSVIDFLDFYLGEHHWPAFNIADTAISLGVISLIILPQRTVPQGENAPYPASE